MLHHIRQFFFPAELNLLLNYPDNPNNWVDIFTHWTNLIGDPALQMWTDVPQSFTVNHDNSISSGTNYIDVEVMDYFNQPVEGAYVTILKGEDIIFQLKAKEQGFKSLVDTSIIVGHEKTYILR